MSPPTVYPIEVEGKPHVKEIKDLVVGDRFRMYYPGKTRRADEWAVAIEPPRIGNTPYDIKWSLWCVQTDALLNRGSMVP